MPRILANSNENYRRYYFQAFAIAIFPEISGKFTTLVVRDMDGGPPYTLLISNCQEK